MSVVAFSIMDVISNTQSISRAGKVEARKWKLVHEQLFTIYDGNEHRHTAYKTSRVLIYHEFLSMVKPKQIMRCLYGKKEGKSTYFNHNMLTQ